MKEISHTVHKSGPMEIRTTIVEETNKAGELVTLIKVVSILHGRACSSWKVIRPGQTCAIGPFFTSQAAIQFTEGSTS